MLHWLAHHRADVRQCGLIDHQFLDCHWGDVAHGAGDLRAGEALGDAAGDVGAVAQELRPPLLEQRLAPIPDPWEPYR